MKLHRSAIALPLVGILAIAGAGVVLATTAGVPPDSGAAVVPAAESPSPTAAAPAGKRFEDTALDTALDTLVADGTITADQQAKIVAAVQAERQARLEERQAAAAVRRADRELIRDALADGAITQDELDKLSPDNLLRQATDLMADGKITKDELRDALHGVMGGRKGGWHRWNGGAVPTASPAPTSGTSG